MDAHDVKAYAPELPEHLHSRMAVAIENAEAAFWSAIADAFPEVKSGDVAPDWVAARDKMNIEFVSSWMMGNLPTLEAVIFEGMKVRLREGVDRGPHFFIEAGATGAISQIERSERGRVVHVRVHMDGHIPGCEEWSNDVIWDASSDAGMNIDSFEMEVEPYGNIQPGAEVIVAEGCPTESLRHRHGVVIDWPTDDMTDIYIECYTPPSQRISIRHLALVERAAV